MKIVLSLLIVLLFQCFDSDIKRNTKQKYQSIEKEKIEQRKYIFKEFNENNLKNQEYLNNFRNKAINFELFSFKKRKSGFELYLIEEEYRGLYDIACFNSQGEILKFISNTEINNLKYPVDIYPEIKNKDLQSLTTIEKEFKFNLRREESLRIAAYNKHLYLENALNVIPSKTSWVLTNYKGNIYIQSIDALKSPKILKSICDTNNTSKSSKATVYLEWKSIKGAESYYLELKKKNTPVRLYEGIIKNTFFQKEISIDFYEENEYEVAKLIAISRCSESEKSYAPILLTKKIEKRNNLETRNKLIQFLKHHRANLDANLIEQILELPPFRKGIVNFEDDKNHFLKLLILCLDENLQIEQANIKEFESKILNGMFKELNDQKIIIESIEDKELFYYLIEEIKELKRLIENKKLDLIYNKSFGISPYSYDLSKSYTYPTYLYNFVALIGKFLKLENREIENATNYIEIPKEYQHLSLFECPNNQSTKNLIKRILYYFYEQTNKKSNKKEAEEFNELKRNMLVSLVESFTHCSTGIIGNLSDTLNNLLAILRGYNSNEIEEKIESFLLGQRDKIFATIVKKLASDIGQSDEEVMYINSLLKSLAAGLKLTPSNKIDVQNWKLEVNNFEVEKMFNEAYKNYFDLKKESKVLNDIKELLELDYVINKAAIDSFLEKSFSHLEKEFKDGNSVIIFVNNYYFKSSTKGKKEISSNFIKALLLKLGYLKLKY